jgi:molecular chaperone DnaK
LSSEELSAEVLKTLKSFVKDENVNSIVITVPAAFKNNQKEATREAAKLAGFNHIELLQEPVAASMAYGLDSNKKDGFWLVFDFGGGTFDAALLKVEEGIMKVIDTEGDNYLGGKNLDFSIVDEIILPYIQENFVIDSILADDTKKQILRNAMKFYAEETKIKLSFNETHNILSDLGDIPGEDDEGEEFELDITVTQADISKALSPVFQKAIDVSKKLLERNNLKGSALDSLILVGGPTFSPVLRKMLEAQICKPDTSADPMTVVSKGAALYASTVDVSEEVREQTRDKTKIQLEIANESSTVETEEFVPIKILADKTEGEIPEKVFAEVTRGDKAWSSGKVEINTIGEVVEIQLNEGKTNIFEVVLFDDKGNILESEPSSFSVIQGSKIGSATLPYNVGIELKDKATGKVRFKTIKGLEKNQSIPAVGTRNSLKTQKQIRPGMDSDFIKIPVYEGEHASEGTRAIYNEHVTDIRISGADLPSLLPENSDVDLTVNIDRSEKITVTAYFPYLDYSTEIEVDSTKTSIETSWLENEIRKAKGSVEELKEDGNSDNAKLQKIETELNKLQKSFENNKNDVDGKQEVLTNLRKSLKAIDELNDTTEWPKLEETLKEEFYRLEKVNNDLGNEKTTQVVNQFRSQLDEVIRAKDVKLGNVLLEEIEGFFIQLTFIYQLIGFIRSHNENFGSFSWKDSGRARTLLNKGLQIIGENPTVDELHPVVISLIDLLPNDERPSGDDSVLVG